MLSIYISEYIHLSPVGQPGDDVAFVTWLNEKQISDNTLLIPYPYTPEDAAWFINHCREKQETTGHHTELAIRLATGELIGGCGFHDNNPLKPHQREIGYWLAKPYWGQGIMTLVVNQLCIYGYETFGLARIEAPVFSFNTASQRVLEKCGFAEEGYLRKSYLKNEQYIDAKLFARIF